MFSSLFGQVDPGSLWAAPSGSTDLFVKLAIGLLFGFGLMFGLTKVPPQSRKYIVGFVTFISGLFYVLYFYWPKAIDRNAADIPSGGVESFSFWLADAVSVVSDFSSILSGFLLGLGIFSIIRIHGRKLARMQQDWFFSLVLLVCLVTITIFGFWDWGSRMGPGGAKLADMQNWGFPNYAKDFLFDGMFQQMDAAMFSLIAFYIISAAYRAFRVRSIEATILLATALIVIISLMGVVTNMSQHVIQQVAGNNPDAFLNNVTLPSIANWIKDNVQTPSIRGIDFGIGVGALAMGLRLWLSLERAGGNG